MTNYKRVSVQEVESNKYIVSLIERTPGNDFRLNNIDSSLQEGYNAIKKVNDLIIDFNLSDETIISINNLEYGQEECTVKYWNEK